MPNNLKGQTVGEIIFLVSEGILSPGTRELYEARQMRDPLSSKHDRPIHVASRLPAVENNETEAALIRDLELS